MAAAAAVMSIHSEMRGWQKLVWMLLIAGLLSIELRAISKDRAESDARALADRKAQDVAFKGIRDNQEADFKSTADGLRAAITGITSTLKSAKQTLQQTRPRAFVHFNPMETISPIGDFLGSGVQYTFNFHVTNDGNEKASVSKEMARIYIGRPDDANEQSGLATRFNREWEKEARAVSDDEAPNEPAFWSEYHIFSVEELSEITHGKTVYFLARIEYHDSTGIWRSDICEHFQVANSLVNPRVSHPCLLFTNPRYKVKP